MKDTIILEGLDVIKIRNMLKYIDEEESKEDYEDMDVDAINEYYGEIINTLRKALA